MALTGLRDRSARLGEVGSVGDLVRAIAVVGIAGLATGVAVGGLGSRLFMRISAAAAPEAAQGALTEAEATVGAITLDGTLGLVLFVGIGAGIVAAVVYAVFRPWLGWARRVRGLAFGAVLLAIASASSDVLNPDNFDFSLLGNRVLNVSLIVVLFLGFGLAMEAVVGAFARRFPPNDERHRLARATYGAITVLGVMITVLLLPTFLFSRSACQCDPPILSSSFVVLTGVSSLLLWAIEIARRYERWLGLVRVLGFTGMAGTLVFGLWRAGSDAMSILTA